MCLSPILIKNPNFGMKTGFSYQKDTVSAYIKVPCGHCAECLKQRQLNFTIRTQIESLNSYVFFCTLTYNNDMIPVVTTSTGFDIRYASLSDVQNMIKRIRKHNSFPRPFHYFAVSERGSEKSRPHFHILWFLPKYEDDNEFTPLNLEENLFHIVLSNWSRNIGTNRKPIYKPLCTFYGSYYNKRYRTTYDLHFVTPSVTDGTTDGVSFYVTKYALKPSDKETRLQQALRLNLSESEYDDVWNLVKSRCFYSKNFGFGLWDFLPARCPKYHRLNMLTFSDGFKYVRSCIDRSSLSEKFPKVYDIETGKSLPMPRYYYNFGNLYTEFDSDVFYFNAKDDLLEGNVSYEKRSLSELLRTQKSFDKSMSILDKNPTNNFDLLLENEQS